MWLESRKLNKLSCIEAEPSCHNSFGLWWLGSGLKWLQVAKAVASCPIWLRFVYCLYHHLQHSNHAPLLVRHLVELDTLVYNTWRCLPGACRSGECRWPLDRMLSQCDQTVHASIPMLQLWIYRLLYGTCTCYWKNKYVTKCICKTIDICSICRNFRIWFRRSSYKEISAYWTYVKLFCGWIAGLTYLFLFLVCFIDLHYYGDSGSMVFHVDWLIFPFFVASHGFSHCQAKLSHSWSHQHGSTVALSCLFGKAKASQPKPHWVKPWQH